jgi:hypothetical protein
MLVNLNLNERKPMSTTLFGRYSQFEDGLIRQFHAHPLYRSFHKLSRGQFINYLLQIGFIAQNFVKWYETAKLGMQSETAREVIRHILRDEIPQSGFTHQDDRLYDLTLIGVSTEQVRNVVPSGVTCRTIERLYELVRYPQEDYDLRVMITLRVAGEVLVAEQYQHIVRYMRVNFGIQPSQSRFYFPHWKHDLKGAKSEGSAGHTDSFDQLLESMLTDERKLEVAMDAARKAFQARSGIHDQFVRKPSRILLQTVTAVVALVLTMFIGTSLYQKVTKPSYYQFLSTLDPKARSFYLDLEIALIRRAQSGIDVQNLHRIGTAKYASEVWGDWP